MRPSDLSCLSAPGLLLLPPLFLLPPLPQMLEARLYSLQEVAGCKQACHSYDGALQTLTQIREEAEGKLCEWGDRGGEGVRGRWGVR